MKTTLAITCLLFAGSLVNAAEEAPRATRQDRQHSRISRRVKSSPRRLPGVPRGRVSTRRAPDRQYTMLIIRPARHTRYATLRVKPNPNVAYQILRVRPHMRQ